MTTKVAKQKTVKNRKNNSEFEQKILDIARVTRVMAGGRRFSFRVTMVIGNKNGKVGVGIGKGKDVSSAIEKAVNDAKKNLIEVPLFNGHTIPHEVEAKFKSARVLMKPAKEGKGVIAGGAVRVVCDFAGIKNLSSKLLGKTKNKINNAQATIKALNMLRKPKVKKEAELNEVKKESNN